MENENTSTTNGEPTPDPVDPVTVDLPVETPVDAPVETEQVKPDQQV